MIAATALSVLLVALAVGAPMPGAARGRPQRGGRRSVSMDRRTSRWLVVGVVALVGAVLGSLALAIAAGCAAAVGGPLVDAVRERRRRAAVAAAVPDLVDLFLIAASAGQPVAAALAVVAPRAPDAVAPSVARARDQFARGLPLADSLQELGTSLTPTGAPLVDALGEASSAGVPLVPLLEGVAATARDVRRRRAQERARRLPVTMLFPLVLCVLPAAVVLAVVPVLVVSLAALHP